jgi:3-phenylpropionate/trans-cinnamate dioxygenase ferredoxin subunit
MSSVQVANKADIPSGTMKGFEPEGVHVLVANCDGDYYAVSSICTHLGGHLADGRLEGCIVTCPRHGASFDVRTGANVGPAKMEPVRMSPAALKTHVVTFDGDAVKVEI